MPCWRRAAILRHLTFAILLLPRIEATRGRPCASAARLTALHLILVILIVLILASCYVMLGGRLRWSVAWPGLLVSLRLPWLFLVQGSRVDGRVQQGVFSVMFLLYQLFGVASVVLVGRDNWNDFVAGIIWVLAVSLSFLASLGVLCITNGWVLSLTILQSAQRQVALRVTLLFNDMRRCRQMPIALATRLLQTTGSLLLWYERCSWPAH